MAEIEVSKPNKKNKTKKTQKKYQNRDMPQKDRTLYIKKHNHSIEIICYKNHLNLNKFDIHDDYLSYSFLERTAIGVFKVHISINPKFRHNLFTNNTENICFKGNYNKFGLRFNYFFDRDKLQLGDRLALVAKKEIETEHFRCEVIFSTNPTFLLKEAYNIHGGYAQKSKRRTSQPVYLCSNPKSYSGGSFTSK